VIEKPHRRFGAKDKRIVGRRRIAKYRRCEKTECGIRGRTQTSERDLGPVRRQCDFFT
jgi:hypothetical protein